jgi:transposase
MHPISAAKVYSIKNLFQHGYSAREIARRLKLSPTTVLRYKELSNIVVKKHVGGRRTKISDSKKRLIKRKVIIGELLTAVQVYRYLVQENYKLSYKTVCRILKCLGFEAQIKKKKPLLSKRHRHERFKWAKKYQHWTVADWSKVIFTDETKINVWGSDGVKYCWKRPGDPLQPHHLDLTVKFGNGNIKMWGCMSTNGVGYACHIEDIMDAEVYCYILGTTFRDSLEYWNLGWQDFVFQQDNDRKHTCRLATKWFSDRDITVLDWPAQSPDLNPIEHLWHHLKLKLSLYEQQASGVSELWQRVDKEWNTFTAEECKRYIKSMPVRVKAVLKAKGGNTRF